MVEKVYNHNTIRELLSDLFFDENNFPFFIIYDANNILSDFFEQEIPNHTEFKLLSIQAGQKPAEFLDRILIVEDFNEKKGWYDHSWIIHVFGKFSNEIESFGSFLYYEIIGRVEKIESFYDLLMIPDLNVIKTKDTKSLLEQEPSLNQFILKYLIDIPLSSYIYNGKVFNECTVWMILFTSNSNINPSQKADSPLWISISQEKKKFSHEKVLLELIYHYDFLIPRMLNNNTIKSINNYLNILLSELKITNLSLSEDLNTNLLRIIQL